ncbi:MAG: helix-turn-helix domain-containing protein [Planctomycetes bacterium]|nr:helix-turn-helix domain-containing protein [Planctomycetota bacterium]
MSQDAVSKSLGRGFSLASLYRWEAGVDLPSFDKMTRLARLYGTSLDWLAGFTEFRDVFAPGKVVVDRDALAKVDALAQSGKSLAEVPKELLHDGLNCAWPVPRNPMVMDSGAAHSIEMRLRSIYQRLRDNR